MNLPLLLHALILFWTGISDAAGVSPRNGFQSDELAREARQIKENACKDVDVEKINDARYIQVWGSKKKTLEIFAGQPNYFHDLIFKVKSFRELEAAIWTMFSSGDFVKEAAPFLIAIVLIIIFLFVCWQPCCPCCMCFSRYRGKSRRRTRFLAAVLFLICALAAIVASATAWYGQVVAWNGVNEARCTTGKFFDITLSGESLSNDNPDMNNPGFVGIFPVVKKIRSLSASLSPESKMVKEIRKSLAVETDIVNTVNNLQATLNTASTTFGETNKAKFKSSEIFHQCHFCGPLSKTLTKIEKQIKNSSASSMAYARELIKDLLSDASLKDLKANFDHGFEPAETTARIISDVIKAATQYLFAKELGDYKTITLLVVLSGLIICLGKMFLGLIVLSLFVKREVKKKTRRGVNPFSQTLPRIACFSWCMNILFAILVLVVAGTVAIIILVPAGACLVADEIDGQKLQEIGHLTTFFEMSQDQVDMFDTCLSPNGDRRILGVVKAEICPKNKPNCRPNEKATSTMEEVVKRELDGVGAAMTQLGNHNVPKIDKDDQFTRLRDFFKKTPLEALITLDLVKAMTHQHTFMLSTDARENGFSTALVASMSCEDTHINSFHDEDLKKLMRGVIPSKKNVDFIPGINRVKNLIRDFNPAFYNDPNNEKYKFKGTLDGNCLYTEVPDCPAINLESKDKDYYRGLEKMIIKCEQSLRIAKPGIKPEVRKTLEEHFKKFKKEIQKKINNPELELTELGSTLEYLRNPNFEDGRPICDICVAAQRVLQYKIKVEEMTMNCPSVDTSATTGAGGGSSVKFKSCTFREWLQHSRDYDIKLHDAAKAVDDSMTIGFTKAMKGLKKIVEKEFVDPLTKNLAGFNCQFIFDTKVEMIDQLCSGTVYGMIFLIYSYIAAGVLCFILAILTYLIWYRANGNLRYWDETREDEDDDGSIMVSKTSSRRMKGLKSEGGPTVKVVPDVII